MPIPDLSNLPGPSRPGHFIPDAGSYDFQFEVSTGQVGILVLPNINGKGFTITWQNGATQIISAAQTNLQSPTTQAGIISINKETDKTSLAPLGGFCDDFAVVSGKQFVTKVISWGKNPWDRLLSAFDGCTNLTSISETSLITGVGCVLSSAFKSCTSLANVNISSWNMTNAARIDQMFDACAGLEVMETGSLNLNLNHTSQFWLRGTGTAVTNGCEYKLNGLNITATSYAANLMSSWFTSMKINPSSSFANISWPSVTHARADFGGSSITGISSTLDCSGWTNYNSTIFPYFGSLTATEGGTSNMKINITNLSVSSVTSFNRSFLASNVSEIIGLNSLGASAGITNMEYALYLCGFLSFSNSNFSNAFINSFSLTSNPAQAFRGVGGSLSSGSAPPNLGSLNISGISALTQMFQSAKFSSAPDFSNVAMSTTNPYDFSSCFNGMAILDNSNMDSLFAKTFKVSSFGSTFSGCQISSVTIGNNVDLSTCTNFNRAFLSASTISDVSFPTNADFSGVTTSTNWQYIFTGGPTLSTCSVDNFIRRLHATALSYGLVINFNNAATTEAPSVVSSKVADLVGAGWTIEDNTTDATLPFAYASYAVDPTGITTISPTTTPPAGSVFTATNGLTISSSGVITINTFRGGSTIRCTYPDGCYNEVVMLIQVPFVMRTVIPGLVGSTTYLDMEVKPQMSAGECFVDWGDSNSETLTGNTTHTYASAGTYDIKIFDAPSGSKFENFTGNFPTYAGINSATYGSTYDVDIIQWGEIQWKNPSVSGAGWFSIPANQKSYIELAAASNNAPDLSQVTSLRKMFGTGGGGAGQSDIARFTDPNDSMRSWNTSTITDMSEMWKAKLTDSSLSLDLSQWNVSNVETFASMFDAGSGNQQSSIGDLDISGWNTQSATNMSRMFYRTSANSVTGLGDLNTSLVSNMSQMFNNCPSGVVGQASETFATKMVSGVLRWDVNNVVSFSSMFQDAEQLSNANFPTNWNITSDGSKTVSMSTMFGGTPAGLTNITNLDAFATKTINETWYGGTSYTAWNMSRVSSLSLFAYASGGAPIARNYNIASWQISNALTSMYYMFGGKNNGNGSVWQQDVGHWDVSGLDDGPNKVSYWLSARNGVNPPNMATSIYDSILDITNGWGSQTGTAGFPTNISWQNGSSKYTAGGNAEAGRTALINAGWTIVDGGAVFSNTNALSFNGSQHINVGEDINSTFQGAFSFSCYIWFNNIDGSFQSFLTSGFPVQAYIVSGAVQMYLSSTNSNSTETLPTSSTLTAGEWHHVAFTRSGNGANSENKIYLNGGVADVTDTSNTTIPLSTSPINIGASTNPAGSTSLYFNGKIDEVMIWNTVLTQGEVQSYADAVGSGSIPDPNAITGLQMWNRMGD